MQKNTTPILYIKELFLYRKTLRVMYLNLVKIHEGCIFSFRGRNGVGKSSFAKGLSGHVDYHIESTIINYSEKYLKSLTSLERAYAGVFFCFQLSPELTGFSNYDFLYSMYKEFWQRKQKNTNIAPNVLSIVVSPSKFLAFVEPILEELELSKNFLLRNVNEHLSGGERKKSEVIQLLILQSKLLLLDELDSGVDLISIRTIAKTISKYVPEERSIFIISHYKILSSFLKPLRYFYILKYKL